MGHQIDELEAKRQDLLDAVVGQVEGIVLLDADDKLNRNIIGGLVDLLISDDDTWAMMVDARVMGREIEDAHDELMGPDQAEAVAQIISDHLAYLATTGRTCLSDDCFVIRAAGYEKVYRTWKLYRTPELAIHPDKVMGPFVLIDQDSAIELWDGGLLKAISDYVANHN